MNNIKKFFKENYKGLLFILAVYILFNYELPYVIYKPGGSVDMSERVSGDDIYLEDGSFNMTYVSVVKGSLPFLGLAKILPNWDIVKTEDVTYEGEDLDETIAIDKLYMKEAISNAEYVAYTKAGIDFEITNTAHTVTLISSDAKNSLKVGDVIKSIDGEDITSLKSIMDYKITKSVGDTITITYERKGKTLEDEATLIDVGGVPKIGIGVASINEYKTEYNIAVESKSSESGPSGGLMTALEIYNRITEYDLTQGLKIMGTGTISSDGKVGEIGGVKYKLLGAVKDKADVFICPKENYKEALKTAKSGKYDIIVLRASTFEEALEKINSLED